MKTCNKPGCDRRPSHRSKAGLCAPHHLEESAALPVRHCLACSKRLKPRAKYDHCDAHVSQDASYKARKKARAEKTWPAYYEKVKGEIQVQRAAKRLDPVALETLRATSAKHQAKRKNRLAGIDPRGIQAAIDSGMRDMPCACCAKPGPSEIDHIIPLSWAEGRPWIAALLAEPTSYQPLCESCNAAKGNRVAVAYVQGVALHLFR